MHIASLFAHTETYQPLPRRPFAGLIARWIERTRQRQALATLDDGMLRDIGITRAEAVREWKKPFWR
jgi:uncharacterized protein YjiS (DUF1127 family)